MKFSLRKTDFKSDTFQSIWKKCPCVFGSVEWLSIYPPEKLYVCIIYCGEKPIGYFIPYYQKGLGFSRLKNMPFCSHSVLMYESLAENIGKKRSFDKKIVSAIVDFVDEMNPSLVTLAFPDHIWDLQPFIWRGYKVVPNYTYILRLEDDPESVWKKFTPERRNEIKKALNDCLEATVTHDYGTVFEMVQNAFGRKGKAFDRHLVEKILFDFATNKNSFAVISERRGKALAAAFVVYDSQRAYYLLGGYDHKQAHHGAGALAIYTAIRHAFALQIPVFDFEGSMLPEVERYFRDFGGELVPYFTVNRAKLSWEMLLKFYDRSRF